MKVLMLTSSFPRYEGDYAGPWILEYCRELVRQGHEVTVIAPGVDGIARDALSTERLRIVRFRYSPLKRLETLARPPGMIPNLKARPLHLLQLPLFLNAFHRAIVSELRSTSFDVLHSQWAIPAGWLGGRIARRCGIPHVITSQGAEFFLPPAHPFSWFTRAALANADRLFPVSDQMARRATRYGADPARTEVIPNTVNTSVFRPDSASDFRERHGIPTSSSVFLTVRRLVHEKRVEDVIDAFASLPDRADAVLVIGGDGPERAMLEARCASLGLSDRVRFIGFVDNSDLPPIYAASDIYVLSSQQEGLSLSMLEAMSSELVVVSTGSTGGEELIAHGRNGFLYDVGDSQALGHLLTDILALAPARLASLKATARQCILDGYSVELMVTRWIDVYRRLAETRDRSRAR